MRLFVAAALLLSSVSFAQTPAGTQPSKRQPPKTEIKFDDDGVIEGGTKGPDGSVITGKHAPAFESMIRLRQNFADKLMASAQDL